MIHAPCCRISELLAALFVVTSIAAGAFLRDVPVTVTQPDGSVLHCYATGDEFHNWLHDRDGFTIIQDAHTGYYMYAVKANEKLRASGFRPGRDNPRTAGLASNVNLSAQDIRDRTTALETFVPQGIALAPRIGTINNVVIFIRFSDEAEFTTSPSTYNTMFNASGPGVSSLHDFFYEVSYGRLEVFSTFYPVSGGPTVLSYQDTEPRAYYMPYSTTNTIGYTDAERFSRERTLLVQAVAAVTAQVPTNLAIDADNDGYVDNVCFIVKGTPTAWSTLLWPHMSSMGSSGPLLAGKKVAGYNYQIESMAQVGVFCHEMMHTLGAPDMYRYASPDAVAPVGGWDIMASTATPPQHPGAYLRYRYMTWIANIPRITASGRYSLRPVSSPLQNCYRIDSPNPGEFFVLEYRKRTSVFENSIPGEGLVMYRIDSLVSGNAGGPPDGIYVYRPGGNPGPAGPQNGTLNSAAFSSTTGRVAINDATNPACYLTSGALGNLDISDVGLPDDSIFFTATMRTPSPPWSKVSVSTSNALNAVSFAGKRAGWIAGSSVVLRSTNGGTSWTNLANAPKTTLYAISALDSLRCWTIGSSTIYKTTDGGSTWSSLAVTVPSGGRLTAMTMASPTVGWVVASGGVIYRTSNGGDSWTLVTPGTSLKLNDVFFLDQAKGWIVGDAGTVLQTSDSGQTWFQRSVPDTTTLLGVAFVDSSNGVAVGRLGRIMQTTNGGTAWSLRPVNTRSHISAVRFAGRDSGWAVGESGSIFKTTNGGAQWWGDVSGTMLSLRGIAAVDGQSQCVVGNTGMVLRSVSSPVTCIDVPSIGLPMQVLLEQNYPNPFNPITTIGFRVAGLKIGSGVSGLGSSLVRLSVYDLLGREVAVLVDEQKAPGEYTVRFDGRHLASGVYLYRLTANTCVQTRKMLLVR
jgi:M6 family metalloprotease-like protein